MHTALTTLESIQQALRNIREHQKGHRVIVSVIHNGDLLSGELEQEDSGNIHILVDSDDPPRRLALADITAFSYEYVNPALASLAA